MAIDSIRGSGPSSYHYITGCTLPDEWWATIKLYAPEEVATGQLQPFFFALPGSGNYVELCLEYNDENVLCLSNHQGNKTPITVDAWHTISIHANGGVWTPSLDGDSLWDAGEIHSAEDVVEFDLGNVGFPFGTTDGFYLKDFHVGTTEGGNDLLDTTIDDGGLAITVGLVSLNTSGTVNAVEGPADEEGDGDGDAVDNLEPGAPPGSGDQVEDDTDADGLDAKYGVRLVYVENHAPGRIGNSVLKSMFLAWHKYSEQVGNHWGKPGWRFKLVAPGHAPDGEWLIAILDSANDDWDGLHLWSDDRVLITIPARNMFPGDNSDLPDTAVDSPGDIVEACVNWDAAHARYVLTHQHVSFPLIADVSRWVKRYQGHGLTLAQCLAIGRWWTDAGHDIQYAWSHGGAARKARFSYAVTHEIAEAIANPHANRKRSDGEGRHYFLEICDPVWPSRYAIDGVTCANWVRKRWFVTGRTGSCDHMGFTDSSHHLPLAGAYALFFKNGTWRQYRGPRAGY